MDIHGISEIRIPGSGYKNALLRVRQLLGFDSKDIVAIAVYGVCSGVFGLVIPISVQTLVNTVAFGTMVQPVIVMTFFVFLFLGLSLFLRALQLVILELVMQRIFARVTLGLAMRMPHVEATVFEKHCGPSVMNRFFDVLTIQKSLASLILDGLSLILQIFFGMVLLAFYHPMLLAFDIILLCLLGWVIFFLGRGAIESSILESKYKYDVAGWLEELARVPLVFKHPRAMPVGAAHADTLAYSYVQSRKKHFHIVMNQTIGTLGTQLFASCFVLGVGGFLVIQRQLTLGQLVASEMIVASVLGSVGKFGRYFESFYDLLAACDKLGSLFDILELEVAGRDNSVSVGDVHPEAACVSFEHVKYADHEHAFVLEDCDFRIAAASKCVILGRRGSGKSVLIDCIYGLRHIQPHGTGIVSVDGVSLSDYPFTELRRGLVLLRDIDLFDGSIEDNLLIHADRSLLAMQDIYSILKDCGILVDIQKRGLTAKLTGGRYSLSHGQAKMVMLARALLARPRLMLLDAFLDDFDDEGLMQASQVLRAMKATVLVTTGRQDIARLDIFDARWRLDQGRVTYE